MIAMLKFGFFLACLISCSGAEANWPRPESLIFFFPFDEDTGLADITNQYSLTDEYRAQLMTRINGPFGQPATSFSVSCDNCYIGYYAPTDIPLTPEFTTSFYYHTGAKSKSAIFMFRGNCSMCPRLAFNYLASDQLEIWGGPQQGKRIGIFPILKPNAWNFFAVTYSKQTGNLTIFNENGSAIAANFTMDIPIDSTNMLYVGLTIRESGYVGMYQTDAIACLMYYNATLTPSEIARLPEVCRTRGGVDITTSTTKRGTTTTPSITPNWPRPESLLAFWPFDDETQLNDIAPNSYHLTSWFPQLATTIAGPFGLANTSYTVSCDMNCWIGTRGPYDIPLTNSFTISLYVYAKAEHNVRGGIFTFWGYPNPFARLSLSYLGPDKLEIWGGPHRETLIGQFPIFRPNQWNFFAITYYKATGNLTVYDQKGKAIATNYTRDIPVNTMNEIYVGMSNCNDGTGQSCSGTGFMKTTDAIACLMVYSARLQPSEISELPEVCRTRGGVVFTTPTTKAESTTMESRTTTKKPTVSPWPRPEALLGFWPLDSQYKLEDIGQNKLGNTAGTTPTFTRGPFGDGETAVSPQMANAPILEVKDSKLSVATTSFTVSFFFKRGAASGNSGGIFEFLHSGGSTNTVMIRYMSPTTMEVGANNVSPAQLDMIQPNEAWTYFAMVYDTSAGTLTIYGRHGVLLVPTPKPQFKIGVGYCNNGIRLGFASRWGKQGLQTGDAVSCLMIYNVSLTADEIRQAYRSCRVMHGSPLCGSPKLPLPAIPPSTSGTSIPEAGQFPYIAAIRSKSGTTCSAAILDAFWLISSANCFPTKTPLGDYVVYVGAHDLGLPEVHRKEHSISRIVVSGSSLRDIVLIQLTIPVDFSSEYLNDACTVKDEDVAELAMAETHFVYGWGKNGRPSLGSQTVPRYSAGKMLSEADCLAQWPDNYTATLDLCYMTSATNQDVPCHGDEGSPLLVKLYGNASIGTSDRLVQYGVYYGRDDTCTKPGLLADLNKWSLWIAENIACVVPGLTATYNKACPQK